MKKYLTSLISVLASFNAWAVSYTGTGNKITEFNDDIIYVNPGAVVEPLGGNISVNYPAVEIHNSGTIIGPIDANDNSFFIYNTGTISGNIITNHGEIVTQIINSGDDRTNFTINPANFRVEVETGSTDINLDNIRSVDAGKIVIKDSRIVMNNFAMGFTILAVLFGILGCIASSESRYLETAITFFAICILFVVLAISIPTKDYYCYQYDKHDTEFCNRYFNIQKLH